MDKNELYAALTKKVGYEVVTESYSDQQVRIEGRLPQSQMPLWLAVMNALMTRANSSEWNIDISKHYFVRGDDVRFAWRIIIQSPDVPAHLSDIVNTIMTTRPPFAEVMEVPLHANPNRNAPVRGKGAQGVLSAVVGPMAFAQQKAGG